MPSTFCTLLIDIMRLVLCTTRYMHIVQLSLKLLQSSLSKYNMYIPMYISNIHRIYIHVFKTTSSKIYNISTCIFIHHSSELTFAMQFIKKIRVDPSVYIRKCSFPMNFYKHKTNVHLKKCCSWNLVHNCSRHEWPSQARQTLNVWFRTLVNLAIRPLWSTKAVFTSK